MRLYFIRHGQSTNNALGHLTREEIELQRSHDPQLTDIGHQQAQHVAAFLADCIDMPQPNPEPLALTHLYVSPMIRALDTAKPIAEALNIQPEIWTDIHEVGGLFTADAHDKVRGFPGLTRSELIERYPNYTLTDAISENGWWNAKQGRETPDIFLGRGVRVALALRKRAHTDEQIALVAHAAFLDVLIKALLNQIPTHPNNLWYNHYNTGITRIDFAESSYTETPDHMRIHYLNRVDHLPVELRTW